MLTNIAEITRFNQWKRLNWFFWITLIFVPLIISSKFPSNGSKAELYAEAGTNFFYHAYNGSFFQNLFLPEYGYLPFLQRLIGDLVILLPGGIESFPKYIQYISLLIIGLNSSFVNLRAFRSLIPEDWVRFILGLSLVLLPDYELYTFINMVYFAAGFLFLVLFYPEEELTFTLAIGSGILSALFFASKALFLSFAPLFGIVFISSMIQHRWKTLTIAGIGMMGALVQAGYIVFSGSAEAKGSAGIFEMLKLATVLWEKLFVIRYLPFLKVFPEWFISLFLLVLFLILPAYLFWKNRSERWITVLLFQMVSIVNLILIARLILGNQDVQGFPFSEIPMMRWFIISLGGISIMGFVMIAGIPKTTLRYAFYGVFAFFLQGVPLFLNTHPVYPVPELSVSQWSQYRNLLKNERYCIPLNPEGWYLFHQCGILPNPNLPESRNMAVHISKDTNLPYIMEASILNRDGEVIATGKQVSLPGSKHVYIAFPKPYVSGEVKLKDALSGESWTSGRIRHLGYTENESHSSESR